MNKLTLIIFLASWINSAAQDLPFKKFQVKEILIDTGVNKQYCKYDLGDFFFYNGIYENNLKFKIVDKRSNKTVYINSDTLSDAMILKPTFFISADRKWIIIMVEVAAEYSWGQEILLIKDKKIKYLDYLDYAVDIGNGESISDYCIFTKTKDKVYMTFKNVPIIYWPEESSVINGKDLKFEIDINGIKKIK